MDRNSSTRFIWWDCEANQAAINDETNNKNLKLNIHKPKSVVLIEASINIKCFTKEEIDNFVHDT